MTAWQVLGRSMPALFITLWIMTAGTSSAAPPGPDMGDKLLHTLAFGACTLSYVPLVGLLPRLRLSRWRYLWAALGSSALGAVLEAWQAALPHRSAEWGDFAADCLGAAIMATLLWLLDLRMSERRSGP